MKKIVLISFLFCTLLINSQKLPADFVYLADIDSSIQSDLRYFGSQNFIGKPIKGYKKNCIITTKKTAIALRKVQKELSKKGFGLKIFDAYRPQKAVNHFVRWAKDVNDTLMKAIYYPNVKKSELFKKGYIAFKSGHSRGSTVDVTIINLKTSKELDMGSAYDFFGIESHPFYEGITSNQKKNRLLLRNIMIKNSFIPYDNEWWHFTLKNEPYPTKYFTFFIE